jgi:hypothetical protein
MGVMVMALFRPKPGKEADLLGCMRDHLPVLRAQGLATDRPTTILRARDGTLVEIFEWQSQAAIDAAHTNPEVGKLWARYEQCCNYVTLADLPEALEMFPGFELVTV